MITPLALHQVHNEHLRESIHFLESLSWDIETEVHCVLENSKHKAHGCDLEAFLYSLYLAFGPGSLSQMDYFHSLLYVLES